MIRHDEDEPMSRQAYREAERRANAKQNGLDDLIHRHPVDSTKNADTVDEVQQSRLQEFRKELTPEEKTLRLKHRLNVAIIVLIVLIIIVYLILFFVG